jgi:hypothetical protein
MNRELVRSVGIVLTLACLGRGGMAVAQTPAGGEVKDPADLYARLSADNAVASAEQATQYAERLKSWGLKAESLPPAERARLGCVEVYLAAAQGDAAGALGRAQQLLKDFPQDAAAQAAAYVAAGAAGDAQLGSDMASKLAQSADAKQRPAWSARRRWMREVGKQSPEIDIRAEDGTVFQTRRRNNRVLLIDFWNTLEKPEAGLSKALVAVYQEYQGSRYFDLVGVNADAEARVAEARAFAKTAGYEWGQVYEKTSVNAPITNEAFRAGNPPWQVLIDAYGYVRAVGSATEPGFRYALRAAVAESEGRFPAVMVRTREGQQAQVAKAEVSAAPAKKDASGKELQSNPEAASKLRQARTYLRTGLKTKARELFEEIIRDYAGTAEAQEAQEYLDSMGSP